MIFVIFNFFLMQKKGGAKERVKIGQGCQFRWVVNIYSIARSLFIFYKKHFFYFWNIFFIRNTFYGSRSLAGIGSAQEYQDIMVEHCRSFFIFL